MASKMKKILSILSASVMIVSALPVAGADGAGNAAEIITVNGQPYIIAGDNLFESPNFINESGTREAPGWYAGTNASTAWDGKIPNPKTGENLVPLEDIVLDGEASAKGREAFYYSSGGALSATGSNYFLCEYITDANLSYWNGQGSLLGYVPIEAGKTYYFSYYVSSWGGSLISSVRYGAINSDNYCQNASDGKITWSGTGYLNVDEYNGNNQTQSGNWAKKEGIITAGEDADYFFFNLFWLQAMDFVCVNNFTLVEVEYPEIIDINPCTVRVYAGDEPVLPSYLNVTYQGGVAGTAKVEWKKTWNNLRDGTYTVPGTVTVGANTYETQAEVTVYSDSISPDYTITKEIVNNSGELNANFGIYTDKPGRSIITALALYDAEGNLNNLSTQRMTACGSDEFSLSLPAPIYSGYTAKTFVWESDALSPLANAEAEFITLTEGGQFMSLSDVTLLDGMFKTAQELNEDYLLAIDPDRLLAPCFESSGLEPKAERYGGWESKKYGSWGENMGISGHSLGHWLSAASSTYLATGSTVLKERLDYAVSELASIQEQTGSGYIGGLSVTPFEQAFNGTISAGGFDLNGAWVPWYSVHKIYQGLIDAYEIAGTKQALSVVTKFADWAVDGLNRMTDGQIQTMLNCEHGGMNEVFAELYKITGNEDYLTAAVRFTQNSILDPLARESDELTGLHANTQIPKIIGAAAIYEQDSARTDYKTASEFFWNTVVNNRSFVIGGNSVSEHFEALGAETLHKKTCETCNTYNMIKLTEHLYSWEHDSEYMDYVENALYNDILGAQDPETGNKMYFTSLLQGHFRVYGTPEDSWWCCTGSGMENPGRYAKCIYYKDMDNLYVNLYIPSQVKWKETGLTLRMETDFPYSDIVKLTVAGGNADASLKLRTPSWLAGDMTVSVNGEAISAQTENGYITLTGSWSEGDEIEISLPMALSVYTARDNENKVAFKYGPIVLGAPLGTEVGGVSLPDDTRVYETDIPDTTVSVPSLKTESANPDDFIAVSDLSTLTFNIDGEYTSNGQSITLVPFYSIHHQFHNVYWYLNSQADPYEKALNDITIDSLTPDGQQDEIGHMLQSGSSHNGSFTSGITTYYWRDAWGSADAYFSYEMTVNPDAANYLYVSYWGSDGNFTDGGVTYTRSFDILIDGEKIASQKLNAENSGNTYNVFYEIPASLTEGKESVTVKFAVDGSRSCAGGVLDVRITSQGSVTI